MIRYFLISLLIAMLSGCSNNNPADNKPIVSYPEFDHESSVTINGYSSHAMEPFISKDGSYLFFNDSNDAVYTSLHYAARINDTVFNYTGEISGVNGSPPHLDAVASMDENDVFYFVSLRNYPGTLENYQTGTFNSGTVTDVKPVKGNFYIDSSGWVIMDAEISMDGNSLYYVNSRFIGNTLPNESMLGIANKTDSLFNKIPLSDYYLTNINNSNYLVYAPSVSADQKEIYFTRIRKGTLTAEVCVSVRSDTAELFSPPKVLNIPGQLAEAPSLAADGSRIYYHKYLTSDGKFHIFSMKRK